MITYQNSGCIVHFAVGLHHSHFQIKMSEEIVKNRKTYLRFTKDTQAALCLALEAFPELHYGC